MMTVNEMVEKNRRRVASRAQKPSAALGAFLKTVVRSHGWSRKTASEKAHVSEGYLCHLLAGTGTMPRPETLRTLAEGWSFSPAEAMVEGGLVTKDEIIKLADTYAVLDHLDERGNPQVATLVRTILNLSPLHQEIAIADALANAERFHQQELATRDAASKKQAATKRELVLA